MVVMMAMMTMMIIASVYTCSKLIGGVFGCLGCFLNRLAVAIGFDVRKQLCPRSKDALAGYTFDLEG